MTARHDADLSPVYLDSVPDGYPRSLEVSIDLRDDLQIFVRPIVPGDANRMANALEFGDSETIQRRFLTGAPPKLHSAIEYLVTIDYRFRLALVAFDANGDSIGVGRYEGVEGDSSAEVAIVVDPGWRSRGVGSALLRQLEPHARTVGIERFTALYQPDNIAVATLLSAIGYERQPMADGLSVATKSLT